MTVEIAILNKEGVALATDSAVTVIRPSGHKIFPSANKLFSLSHQQPVGIMIYGQSRFMGVPWETIIKIYRFKIKNKKFKNLNDYAKSFINFLKKPQDMFPEIEQNEYFIRTTFSFFAERIRNRLIKLVEIELEKSTKVTKAKTISILSQVLKEEKKWLNEQKSLFRNSRDLMNSIIKKYRKDMDNLSKSIFEKFPLSKSNLNSLRIISAKLLIKDIFPKSTSGVVIAGFGENEHFPSLVSFKIDGIFLNKLKYKETKHSTKITPNNSAAIVPFAQREMVDTFIGGIDPHYNFIIMESLSKIFDKYPQLIADTYGIKETSKIKSLKKETSKLLKTFFDYVNDFKREEFVEPVVSVVGSLPKDEMADMVENLVSLTSFKHRIREDLESVGGPIDVAVISKGDGFVWIKKKQYFDTEINKL